MLKMSKDKKREAGAVTIEATIALTSFLFMFMMIFSVITICRAQARVQIAINATAKELSQYSYLYGMTGLDSVLNELQGKGEETKAEVNGTIENVANIFGSIEAIGAEGQEAVGKVQTLDPQAIKDAMGSWETVSGQMENIEVNADDIKQKLEAYSENPQELLFGMAKLLASESLELAKSRVIAEPVCRALVKKHLKRHNDDTAEAFCQSVGIVPGTYLGKESYFNGMDFSNSTLFPYGSDEINIVVTYKVKLLQLLPIDLDFTITQSALTKGWLHGDMTPGADSAGEMLTAMKAKGENLWNSPENWGKVKQKMISEEVDNLKTGDYYGVSGQTYIHAYDPDTNTFAMVSAMNPLFGVDSIDEVDKEALKDALKTHASQINSATDNMQSITIKKLDEHGNFQKVDYDCTAEKTKKVVILIPEDEGLKELMEELVTELGSEVQFEFKPVYGSVYVEEKKEGGES